jgi:hypothetical protein
MAADLQGRLDLGRRLAKIHLESIQAVEVINITKQG